MHAVAACHMIALQISHLLAMLDRLDTRNWGTSLIRGSLQTVSLEVMSPIFLDIPPFHLTSLTVTFWGIVFQNG